MEPQVIFVLLILFVVFPAVLFNGIAKIKAARAKEAGGGEAMRVSELKAMIHDAVEEATAPLRERIEWIEAMEAARTDDVRLLGASGPEPLLPLDGGGREDDARAAEPALRPRTSA